MPNAQDPGNTRSLVLTSLGLGVVALVLVLCQIATSTPLFQGAPRPSPSWVCVVLSAFLACAAILLGHAAFAVKGLDHSRASIRGAALVTGLGYTDLALAAYVTWNGM